jgi:hypothetical protein
MSIRVLFTVFSIQVLVSALSSIPGYELNVVPADLDVRAPLPPKSSDYNKHIPRNVWMAVKDIKDELPGHIKEFFKRNPLWKASVCDNACKDQFINTTFAGGILSNETSSVLCLYA